jgi:hypothetical protein
MFYSKKDQEINIVLELVEGCSVAKLISRFKVSFFLSDSLSVSGLSISLSHGLCRR